MFPLQLDVAASADLVAAGFLRWDIVDFKSVVYPIWELHGTVLPVEPELSALVVVVLCPGEGIVDIVSHVPVEEEPEHFGLLPLFVPR